MADVGELSRLHTAPIDELRSNDTGEEASESEEQSADESGEATTDETQADEESEGEDEGTEGSDETSADQFLNFEDLPEDERARLEPSYRKMQAAYTRKTQEIAAHRKAIAEERESFSSVRDLLNTPEFKTFLRMKESGELSGEPKTAAADITALGEELENPALAKLIVETVNEAVSAQIGKHVAPVNSKMADMEAERFIARHPDWKQYEAPLTKVLQENPNMGYETAYRLVSQPSLKQENLTLKTRIAELERLAKKRGTVESGEGPTSGGAKKKSAAVKVVDFDSAIASATAALEEGE